MTTDQLVGPVLVGDVAHGGHCVARLEDPAAGPRGRVVFVRHALPGERVRIRLTDVSHARFWRGDAVEILEPSPDRRTPPCPVFHPGGCGGCDFQHATEAAQRELKTQVVRDQLRRLGGVEWTGAVEEVAPVWRWRTRMRYQVTPSGPGMLAHRSHDIVPLPSEGCAIAAGPRTEAEAQPDGEVLVVVSESAGGMTPVVSHTKSGEPRRFVQERAAGRTYEVAADGFWQVHPRAADLLVAAVLEGLQPQAGERAFDLYCGVGLFAGALADRGVLVWGVESGKAAVAQARKNVPEARFSAGRVEQTLRTLPKTTDLVVLDPPRAGAGRAVLEQVAKRRPRAVAYVACDPAALGRDLGYAAQLGWEVTDIRAFDLFPQTHHVECVAILAPRV